MTEPAKCKYGHRAATNDDMARMVYYQRLDRSKGLSKGTKGGKAPWKMSKGDGGKGKTDIPSVSKAPAVPAFKVCPYYSQGTCSYGEACTNVHHNPDGKTVKTAAPARARSAARTASIRANREAKRAASRDSAAPPQ